MRSVTFAAAACLVMAASPAFALEVVVEKTVAAQAGAAWTAIGDFCGVANWHPAIEKCAPTTVKKREARDLSLKGGGKIVEALTAWDREGMSYSYDLISGPLPVRNYSAALSVKPTKDGAGAVLTWRGKFKAAKGATDADAKKTIAGVYQAGLDALAQQIVGK